MLYGKSSFPCDGNSVTVFRAWWHWRGRDEAHAAADYALDGTLRSHGTNGDDRRPGQGGDWSPSRAHRWWLIDHRAGLA